MTDPIYTPDTVAMARLLVPHWPVIAVALKNYREYQFAMAAGAGPEEGWAGRGAEATAAMEALEHARRIMPVLSRKDGEDGTP